MKFIAFALVLISSRLLFAQSAPQKWEYGDLGQTIVDDKVYLAFHSPNKNISQEFGMGKNTANDALAAIYHSLGGKGRPIQETPDHPGSYGTLDLLNALGSQGWELIYHERGGPLNSENWVFKRETK